MIADIRATESCVRSRKFGLRANTLWGAPRIHGELLKLGVDVAERTVSQAIPRRDSPPSKSPPKHGRWDRQAKSLDPKSGALEPIRTEALDTARPPAQQLRWNARATHRAMEGWQRVRSQQDWEKINAESGDQYESGGFLLERLGADRFLDPKLMATILALRQRLIAESAITTAAETMLVDLAVLSYYQTLRVQGWIEDSALRIEHEFFGDDALAARRGRQPARSAGSGGGPCRDGGAEGQPAPLALAQFLSGTLSLASSVVDSLAAAGLCVFAVVMNERLSITLMAPCRHPSGFVSPPHDSPSEALQISTDVVLSAVMLAAFRLRWRILRSLLTTPAIFNDLNLTIDTS